MRYDRDDGCVILLANFPDMQIRNPVIRIVFNGGTDGVFLNILNAGIQQHGTGCTDQAERPVRDDQAADNTHYRIEPEPAEVLSGQQCGNGQYRSQRIRQYMQVCGSQVVIVVMIIAVIVVIVVIVAVMMVVIFQQPGTEQIHRQANGGDDHGLMKENIPGFKKTGDRLQQDKQCHNTQYNRAGKPGQNIHLSGTE